MQPHIFGLLLLWFSFAAGVILLAVGKGSSSTQSELMALINKSSPPFAHGATVDQRAPAGAGAFSFLFPLLLLTTRHRRILPPHASPLGRRFPPSPILPAPSLLTATADPGSGSRWENSRSVPLSAESASLWPDSSHSVTSLHRPATCRYQPIFASSPPFVSLSASHRAPPSLSEGWLSCFAGLSCKGSQWRRRGRPPRRPFG